VSKSRKHSKQEQKTALEQIFIKRTSSACVRPKLSLVLHGMQLILRQGRHIDTSREYQIVLMNVSEESNGV